MFMKAFCLGLIYALFSLGCAVNPVKEVKTQKGETIMVQKSYEQVFELLKDKMQLCYVQSRGRYHLMGEGDDTKQTVANLEQEAQKGIIYYQVKNEFKDEILFYLEIQSRAPAATTIEVYGRGEKVRTSEELHKNLKAWLKGEKGYCIGQGYY
jgi:hypothetical protein